MVTRHEMVILKRAQRKLFNLSDIALKQGKTEAAKDLSDESAILMKVISYFEDIEKMRKK